jgi:radical SAM superfamily enzyme YgiQ (UPF0313 family)
MRVLLSGPIQKDAEVQNWGAPCLGIIKIAEYTKHYFGEKVEVLLYDSQIDKFDPIEKWRGIQIDVLGVSLLHYTLFDTLVFLKKFKEIHPEVLIVIGGNEAGANYQDVFEKSATSFVVTAEGEEPFVDIILWKLGEKKLEDINGIIYRKYAKPITNQDLWNSWENVNFFDYRYPDYWKQIADLYKEPDYEKIKYVRLMTVSHCQRGCTFCSLPMVRTTACGQRVDPVALTGEQIMCLVDKVHTQLPETRTIYYCTDDVYYPNRQPFLDFIELYKQSGYDYRILIQTSTFSIQEEDFPSLKEINCQHITVGFENCSSFLRKEFRKAQKIEKMEKIIEWGKEYGISIYILIILIPPKATLADLITNYETISRWVEAGVQVSVEPVVFPYRGSPIFEFGHEICYETLKEEGIEYRDAKCMLPDDPDIRDLCLELLDKRGSFVDDYFKNLPHKHRFKGSTAIALISLLGQLLRKRYPHYNYKGL